MRDKFPFEIIPKIAALGIGGVAYKGYGSAGGCGPMVMVQGGMAARV